MTERNRPEMVDQVLAALQRGGGPRDAAIMRAEFQRIGTPPAEDDGPSLAEFDAAKSLWQELEEGGSR